MAALVFTNVLLVGCVAWLTLGPSGAVRAPSAAVAGATSMPTRAATARGPLTLDERSTISVFEQVSPSVVYITTTQRVRRGGIFRPRIDTVEAGSGSGFVWDERGHIVTNFHVIADAAGAFVTLADGSRHAAELVGAAPDQDLAVLRITVPSQGVSPIPVGTSGDLRVGQHTLAIGNPFGLDHTLTTGVISALDREMDAMTGRTIYGVIQTDAAINPGNSGGPLLDSAGRLIGVNTAIQSPSGAYAGIGFAVPVATVARIVPQLVADGRVRRPGLGIVMLGDHQAARLRAPGVVIRQLVPDSGAAAAGLKPLTQRADGSLDLGDVIVAVDGQTVTTQDDLVRLLDPRRVGERVTVDVDRSGARRSVRVELRALD